jgi:hypothetical protein
VEKHQPIFLVAVAVAVVVEEVEVEQVLAPAAAEPVGVA